VKRPIPTRGAAAALVAGAAVLAMLQGTAAAATPQPVAPGAPAARHAATVGDVEQSVARELAASLDDPAWRGVISSAAIGGDDVDLSALTAHTDARTGRALHAAVTRADGRIASAKGLAAKVGSLLRLRLGTDAMRDAVADGTTPWVVPASTGDNAKTVTAYDSSGGTHTLSTAAAPDHPVYVVDIDGTKATAAGLRVVREVLAANGVHAPSAPTAGEQAQATAGFPATKVDSVRLNDDEEPWAEGDAEIFSLVSGFGPDGKVAVDSVDMPYLDNDGTTYYPNQILVNWSQFKYDAADVVMMEDDGDANYRDLAKAVADALLTITDQGAYVPLVNAVLGAIPDSWYTNDPDYVDSWYTLTTNSSGTLHGARGNGTMTVSPYWVNGL
jgi:DUF3103 family protein